MDKKIFDSLLYFRCLRETLAIAFPAKQNEILNEMTDYQILYLVRFGKFTEHKHSNIGEKILVENLKLFLLKNIDYLNEVLTEEQSYELMNLVPLSEYYLTSSGYVLNELIKHDFLEAIPEQINEQVQQQHRYEWRRDPETGDKLLVDVTANKIIKRVPADTDAQKLERIMQRALMASNVINTVGMAGRTLQTGAAKLGSGISTLASWAKKTGTSAASVASNIASKLGYANIGYAALTAALLYGATKLYKNYLTKAARACSHLSGMEKDDCMRRYKTNAIRMQISDLRKSMAACNKTTNPQQCRLTIQTKINKLKDKATMS